MQDVWFTKNRVFFKFVKKNLKIFYWADFFGFIRLSVRILAVQVLFFRRVPGLFANVCSGALR